MLDLTKYSGKNIKVQRRNKPKDLKGDDGIGQGGKEERQEGSTEGRRKKGRMRVWVIAFYLLTHA